uniref:Uncharacterized protein n=1 Tax=Caenorhabditis japonica TaxID=281687 RepID=A0A8R1J048_CAEJA
MVPTALCLTVRTRTFLACDSETFTRKASQSNDLGSFGRLWSDSCLDAIREHLERKKTATDRNDRELRARCARVTKMSNVEVSMGQTMIPSGSDR